MWTTFHRKLWTLRPFSIVSICLIKIWYLYEILQSSRCPFKLILPFTAFLIAPLKGAHLPLTLDDRVCSDDLFSILSFRYQSNVLKLPFLEISYLFCQFWPPPINVFSTKISHNANNCNVYLSAANALFKSHFDKYFSCYQRCWEESRGDHLGILLNRMSLWQVVFLNTRNKFVIGADGQYHYLTILKTSP